MLIGNRVPNTAELFLEPGARPKALNISAERAFVWLITRALRHPNTRGPIKTESPAIPYLASALFARAGRGGSNGLKSLCGLFETEDVLRDALVARAGQFFGISTLDQIEDLAS